MLPPAECSGFLGVFLLELLHTTGRVEKHLLARKEGVGSRTYLHFNNGIFFAIGPGGGFLGFKGRTGQELKIAGSIPKNHFSIFRMDVLFHINRGGGVYVWCCFEVRVDGESQAQRGAKAVVILGTNIRN